VYEFLEHAGGCIEKLYRQTVYFMAKYKLHSIAKTRLQVRTRKTLKNSHWEDTNQKKVYKRLILSPD